MLMETHPKVAPREAIETALGGEMLPGSDALHSHIYALRQAIDKPFS